MNNTKEHACDGAEKGLVHHNATICGMPVIG